VITGEVKFPGRYTLTNRSERLTELIERAGGTTTEAYARGVVFHRTQDKVGRIGIDLERALRNPRSRDNLILEDADSIHVPAYQATVNVTGQVNAPVAVAYVPGQSIDYYIAAAGGPNQQGDASRAYVRMANGKVETARRLPLLPDPKPEPDGGSTVVVPQRNPADRIDYLALIGSIASTLTAAVTTYILIQNARN
jgi:polysaccharide biosynthesis/export protein